MITLLIIIGVLLSVVISYTIAKVVSKWDRKYLIYREVLGVHLWSFNESKARREKIMLVFILTPFIGIVLMMFILIDAHWRMRRIHNQKKLL